MSQKQPQKNIKTKEQTLNINLTTITAKTPSTKPTLIQTKHYHNNLNKTFSKIIKKKQSNSQTFRFTILNKNITTSQPTSNLSCPSFPLSPFFSLTQPPALRRKSVRRRRPEKPGFHHWFYGNPMEIRGKMMGTWMMNHGKMMGKWWENDGKMMENGW